MIWHRASCTQQHRVCWVLLLLLALACSVLYAAITILSRRFEYDQPVEQRPIVLVLVVFAAAFLCYVAACRIVCRLPNSPKLMLVIIATSLLFRLILIPSAPIQEVDIYRYIWDGCVVHAGENPYRYAPQAVNHASVYDPGTDGFRRLVQIRDSDPAMRTIVRRVHFAHLPTVYPPVAQAVFAGAFWTTPVGASVHQRLMIFKSWFVVLDLFTLGLVFVLLQAAGKPLAWAMWYGWCPLLMKEIANSGHMDMIAVTLTTLAAVFASWAMRRSAAAIATDTGDRWGVVLPVCSLVTLVLGVGAKLYPVILAPVIMSMCLRQRRWYAWLGWAAAFVLGSFFVLSPLLVGGNHPLVRSEPAHGKRIVVAEPLPAPPLEVDQQDTSLGLRVFLRSWEMNDFLFLLVSENIKPDEMVPAEKRAWFVVVPNWLRSWLCGQVERHAGIPLLEVPFAIARCLTLLVTIVLAGYFCWQATRSQSVAVSLEAVFLTLAWFWLLCPTQNPWYWTWPLPFLVFARNGVWKAVSAVVLVYYLRFWLWYHWTTAPVAGTRYAGPAFFDLVVVWLQYGPWLVLLLASSLIRHRRPIEV